MKNFHSKQLEFPSNPYICKKHKYCKHISKSKFLTLLGESHLNIRTLVQEKSPVEHYYLALQTLRKPHLEKQRTFYLRHEIGTNSTCRFFCESQHLLHCHMAIIDQELYINDIHFWITRFISTYIKLHACKLSYMCIIVSHMYITRVISIESYAHNSINATLSCE